MTTWFSGLPDVGRRSAARARPTASCGAGSRSSPASTLTSPWPSIPVLPVQSFRLPAVDVAGSHVDLGATPAAVSIGRLDLRWSRGGQIAVDVDFGHRTPRRARRRAGRGPRRPGDLRRGHARRAAARPAHRLDGRRHAVAVGHAARLAVHRPRLRPRRARRARPMRRATRRSTSASTARSPSRSRRSPSAATRCACRVASPSTTSRCRSAPVAWVLQALDLPKLAALLPSKLPVRDLPILTAARELDVDLLLETIVSDVADMPNIELPAGTELRDALQTFADRLDQLPERLMPYLDIHVPEHLAFDVAGSVTGAVRGRVSVATADGAVGRDVATPLRLLFPGLSATGPVLNGIELWSLSIGEILGGAALVVTADLNVDQFDILPLAAMLAAPDAARVGAAADRRTSPGRLVAERVTLLIVPEAFVVVPVFFDDLGVEYRGIEGIELGAHLSFPQPSVDLAGAFALFGRLKSFFTRSRRRCSTSTTSPSSGLDLELTAGPAFLQLPELPRWSAARLAHGHVVGLRRRRPHPPAERAQAPAHRRAARGGSRGDAPGSAGGDPARRDGTGRHRRHLERVDAARLVPWSRRARRRQRHGRPGRRPRRGRSTCARPAPTPSASASRSTARSATSSAMHLDGALDTGALTRGAGGGVLTFTDPSARVRTSGPIWAPPQFTVEFWLRPTALSNYNQTVSADDRWGAFVFHTTDGGAVYCGTDGVTRFTPADLPAGTVRAGVWQHIADLVRPRHGRRPSRRRADRHQARTAPARTVDRHAPRDVGPGVADPGRRRRAAGVGSRPVGVRDRGVDARAGGRRRAGTRRLLAARRRAPGPSSTTGPRTTSTAPRPLTTWSAAATACRRSRSAARQPRRRCGSPAPAASRSGGRTVFHGPRRRAARPGDARRGPRRVRRQHAAQRPRPRRRSRRPRALSASTARRTSPSRDCTLRR